MSVLRIGIDFDNTIANYDAAFIAEAAATGLVPGGFTGTKQTLRDHIRRLEDGEMKWQRLQGRIYGPCMPEAVVMEGVEAFLARCRARDDITVFIVSHKSEFGHFDDSGINLRDAAWQWMEARGFFAAEGFAIAPDNVFFEGTRDDKILRIGGLDCTHFIDDLVEVLDHPGFPEGVERILFSSGAAAETERPYPVFARWHDIAEAILG